MQTSIKHKLPDKFSIVFDSWSEVSVHYIGVSASYITMMEKMEVVSQTVLSMRPLLADNIKGMTAQDHLHHLSKMLNTYGKTDASIVCFVGDNCGVNQSMSKILKVPLIGCGSHKFNLAVQKWISNRPQLEDIIQRIAGVMKKASTLKVSAQLRKLTTLCPVKENDTRWLSTFYMIERFFRIQCKLSAVADLIPLIPSLFEVDLLAKGFVHLKRFNQVTKSLQEEGITFVRVREMFDTILDDYPELNDHIGADASIIVDKVFEKSVMQIVKGRVLNVEQRVQVQGLLRPQLNCGGHAAGTFENIDHQVEGELSYVQKIEAQIKRRKTSNDEIACQYINLDILSGTSVSCERLFSAAKHILTDTRKSPSTAVVEALLLLKVNCSEWSVQTMGRAMGQTRTGTRFVASFDDIATCIATGEVDTNEDPDMFYTTTTECWSTT
jgi:hypothetical protein